MERPIFQKQPKKGFTVVPFWQGYKDMSPPTKELMKLVLEGKIDLRNYNEVLRSIEEGSPAYG